jgi:hypothetical protein
MRATDFIIESVIKLRGTTSSAKAKNWIEKVYAKYPGTWENNHVMVWGQGNDQQFAMFELIPSFSKQDAVEVKWFQAYPLRSGVGTRAMRELQALAKEDGISLTLYPWDKGKVSQAKLTKFYKSLGFIPQKNSKDMEWNPENINEAPLQSYTPMGDFNKPGPFRGPDKKLVPHPTNILKTQRFLEKTPYDFRLFFSNIPGTGKYSEYGPMDANQLKEIFGDQADQIINGSDDAVTVVFVGNAGDAKVPMTPWIMAHRFGHAIQAGQRGKQVWSTWGEAEKHFFSQVNSMLEEYYGKASSSRFGVTPSSMRGDLTPEYNALFNAIGTQRSSRNNEIKRPYEFLYEIFAQYLGTGKVTFKPLPGNLGYGKKAWGNPSQYLNMKPEYKNNEDARDAADILGRDMEYMFDDVLSSSVGKIFVM